MTTDKCLGNDSEDEDEKCSSIPCRIKSVSSSGFSVMQGCSQGGFRLPGNPP